jgi:hypothetical protein
MVSGSFEKGALKFANAVFVLVGVFFALLLAHYIANYEKHWYGTQSILIHYAFPLAVAALAFSAVKLQPALRINVALTVFCFAVSAYGFESYLAVSKVLSPPLIIPDAGASDPRSGFERFKVLSAALRERGIVLIPRMNPSQWATLQVDGTQRSRFVVDGKEFWPLGSISNRKSLMCKNYGEDWITLDLDEHGFNNPRGVWSAGAADVIALGDSQTFGECVQAGRSYVDLVRRAFPRTLNLGMRGNGPTLMLASLQEYGPAVKPKYVLWCFAELGDMSELLNERTMPFVMDYLRGDKTQGLLGRQADIDRLLDQVAVERMKQWEEAARGVTDSGGVDLRRLLDLGLGLQIVKLWNIRQRLGLVADAYTGELREENFDLLAAILKKARDQTASWGGTLVFVYTPSPQRYVVERGQVEHDNKVHAEVMKRVKRLGMPIVDLREALEAAPDPTRYFLKIPFPSQQDKPIPVGHFNEEGHALAARTVVEALAGLSK